MRAPQYGVNSYKAGRRGRLNDLAPSPAVFKPYHVAKPRSRLAATRPNAAPVSIRMVKHKLPAPFTDRLKVSRSVGISGANSPLPMRRIRYLAPKQVKYSNGVLGAPCTLHLHHKSAVWDEGVKVGGEGPIVTKRYAVLENSHRLGGHNSPNR